MPPPLKDWVDFDYVCAPVPMSTFEEDNNS